MPTPLYGNVHKQCIELFPTVRGYLVLRGFKKWSHFDLESLADKV